MILLNSSLAKGIAYVETKNLDGETNLKQKQASLEVQKHLEQMSEEQILTKLIGMKVECEHPNEFLYKFQGNFVLESGKKVPMDPDQILLKGSCLRNT